MDSVPILRLALRARFRPGELFRNNRLSAGSRDRTVVGYIHDPVSSAPVGEDLFSSRAKHVNDENESNETRRSFPADQVL